PARVPVPALESLGHRRARPGGGARRCAARIRRGAPPHRARGRRPARAYPRRRASRRHRVDAGARADRDAACRRRDPARLDPSAAIRGGQAGSGVARVRDALGRRAASRPGRAHGPGGHPADRRGRAAARGPRGASRARSAWCRGRRAAARLHVGPGLGGLRADPGPRSLPGRRHARAADRAPRARALRRAMAPHAAGPAARRRPRRIPRLEPRAARAARRARLHRRRRDRPRSGALGRALRGGGAREPVARRSVGAEPARPGGRGLRARAGRALAASPWPDRRHRRRDRAHRVRRARRGPASRRGRRAARRRRRLSGAGGRSGGRSRAVARPAHPAVTARSLITAPLITPTIAACLAISGGVHVVIYLLNATLPLHVVALGGSKTQVGLLFATSTTVSMILRPLVGGWVDRFGARRVMLPGVGVLLATLVLLPLAAAPAAYVTLMAGLG